MSNITPNFKKRSVTLPAGYKDLIDLLVPGKAGKKVRPLRLKVNGKIQASTVNVKDSEGQQIGILPLSEALTLARTQGLDLIEIDHKAVPPICVLMDFGTFQYRHLKRKKPG